MTDPNPPKKRTLVDLFSKDEMKNFFIRYIVMIGFVELFIFFISFLSTLEPYPSPFPWREYFYAAFTIPIAVTFLLGIIVIAFNTFYFQESGHFEALKKSLNEDASATLSKSKLFLSLSWQFQFLLFLLALGASSLFLFHINDFLALLAHSGEKAFNWLLLFAGIFVAGAIVFGFLYLWFHYKLHKKRMEYANQFKWELMSRMGMVMLDNRTLIDREGNVISGPDAFYDAAKLSEADPADDLALLPHIARAQRKGE